MTMKDRHILQETFRTCYRTQERNDVMALRRDAAKRTTFRDDPQYNYEERVKTHMNKHGRTREEAEAMVDNVILTKEQKAVPEGQECQLEQLALGQHFSTETKDAVAARKAGHPVVARSGYLMYVGPGSVLVRITNLDRKPRSFVSNGKSVEFIPGNLVEQRMAPDMLVVALKKVENLALLQEQTAVQLSSGNLTTRDQMEDVMADAEKAVAKKTAVKKVAVAVAKKAAAPAAPKAAKVAAAPKAANGNGAPVGRAPSNPVIVLAKEPKEGELRGQSLAITTLLKGKKNGMPKTALIEAIGIAIPSKNVLGAKDIWAMNRKKLIEGGFVREVAE